MRKFLAAAVGSVVALLGFAGAANASATIELIWAATGTNQIGGFTDPVSSSDDIVLKVILTGSPAGSLGTGVSVDFSGAVPSLTAPVFASTPGGNDLPLSFGTTLKAGSRIQNLNAAAAPFANAGIGLAAGANIELGTITFHVEGTPPTGIFEIKSDANSPADGVLDSSGKNIAPTTTFKSAFVTITGPDDVDGDGINNVIDNCLNRINIEQDDSDQDGCGNLCDADYNQTGKPDFPDFGLFSMNFGCTSPVCEKFQHVEPIGDGLAVGFPDFGFFSLDFGVTSGPSGTTSGTLACP